MVQNSSRTDAIKANNFPSALETSFNDGNVRVRIFVSLLVLSKVFSEDFYSVFESFEANAA